MQKYFRKQSVGFFLLTLIAGSFLVHQICRAENVVSRRPPNVIFLLSDDQRFDTIHALGNRVIQTPNLDRLVRNGFTFTHAFCMGSSVGAVCVPSRAMLLTGRTLFRSTATGTSNVIPPELPIWPEVMKKAGYATFGAGKWHNDSASFVRGFSHGGVIFFGGMTDQRKVPVQDFRPDGKYDKTNQRIGEVFSSELFANSAIKFLQEQKGDKPFFMYVAFTAPHDPRTPPKEYVYDPGKMQLPKNFLSEHPFDNGELKVRDEQLLPWPRTPDAVRKELADYYGMITHLDAQIGRILKALDQSGQAGNTIVIFTSDHGLAIGSHGLLGKQNLYDHSVRPPLIFSGPGISKGRRSDALCYLFDIFPTVCALTGIGAPDSIEGKSLLPVIAGKQEKVRDSVFCAYRDVQRMVRTERWKLIRYPQVNQTQLFNLAGDPDELNNLADRAGYAKRVDELNALLTKWQNEVGDPLAKN